MPRISGLALRMMKEEMNIVLYVEPHSTISMSVHLGTHNSKIAPTG